MLLNSNVGVNIEWLVAVANGSSFYLCDSVPVTLERSHGHLSCEKMMRIHFSQIDWSHASVPVCPY